MELISQLQKQILKILPGIPDSENFYLTGGTALSTFYLEHRQSNDLDFFTAEQERILPFSYQLEEELEKLGMTIERQRKISSFVELVVKKESVVTVVHLACDSPFRFEAVKEFKDFPGIKVDSLIDIATNKLLALFGRAAFRDFIDVYFLIKKGKFTAEELMNKAKIKDPGFDLYWLGVALERINTFKENSPDMFLLIEPLDFGKLSDFFNQWRKTITQQLCGI